MSDASFPMFFPVEDSRHGGCPAQGHAETEADGPAHHGVTAAGAAVQGAGRKE